MTEFDYSRDSPTPFPQIVLRLAATKSGRFFAGLTAKVDTGADRTVVPQHLLDPLQLAIAGERDFEVAHGSIVTLPLFYVELTIEGLAPFKLIVAASDREDLILLGRDVLNLYRLVLDGPNLRLAISDRGTGTRRRR